MTDPILEIAAGWTDPLPFTLMLRTPTDVDFVPADLTSKTVTLVIAPFSTFQATAPLPLAGTVTVQNQASKKGQVTFTPAPDDFPVPANGPTEKYTLRWRAVDPSGNVVFFPEGEPDTLIIYQP